MSPLRLADRLLELGLGDEAIRALDNCLAVHHVYPYYGQQRDVTDPVKQVFPLLLEVWERLDGCVRKSGDLFDRATIPVQLAWTRQVVESRGHDPNLRE